MSILGLSEQSAGYAVAAIIAGGWAVVSYLHNKSLEYKKAFNDRQLDIIMLTAQTAGELVGSDEPKDWERARARFWELYWGRLVLFEDDPVVRAMIALGARLVTVPFERRAEMKEECYTVSRALRDFLARKNQEDWKISFEMLNTSKADIDSDAELKQKQEK
jgi:hypothetical protein